MRKSRFKYDVALSYAGEDRPFVEQVAEQLRAQCIKVYFDKYETEDAWGEGLFVHLDDVYRNKARYCVMFISQHYKEKVWTKYERQRAQARAYENNKLYILPFRFDDTIIEGLPDDVIYLNAAEYDAGRLSDVVIQKIKQSDRLFFLRKVRCFLIPRMRALSVISAVLLFLFIFLDNLTPPDILAQRLYARSRYKAAVCKDGSLSRASGRGTCSYHKGKELGRDTVVHSKTMKQCRSEAEDISWLP